MVYHRPIKGKGKTCTIRRSSTGKWYVSFSVECDPERLPKCQEQVGIDVGLSLAKSIADASWSAFFAQLFAKAEEAGRIAVKVNPANTSQTCSRCGHRQKMPLDVRVFACPCCHVQCDRDLNATLNICGLGLQALGLSVDAPAFTHRE